MEKLRLEIKHAIELMQGDICEKSHEELRKHLSELLCMARNELQRVLTEESWGKDDKGVDSNENTLSEIVEPYKSVRINGDSLC